MALRQSDKHESANAQVFCGAPTRFQTSRIHVKSIAVDVCTERWRYLKGFAASKPVHVPPSADVDSRVTLSLQMENENKKSIKRSNIVRRQFSIEMWFECSQSIQLCQSDTAHQRTIGGTTIRLNFVSIAADARIVCAMCRRRRKHHSSSHSAEIDLFLCFSNVELNAEHIRVPFCWNI